MKRALILLAVIAALPLAACKLQTGGVVNGNQADMTGKPADTKPAEQPKTP